MSGASLVTYAREALMAVPGVGAIAGALMYAGRGQQKLKTIEGRVIRLEGGERDYQELRETVARIDERTLAILRALTPHGHRNGG